MNILIRARYVATDLVTSQNFQSIRCAFMLCQFERARNVYEATKFILFSSTVLLKGAIFLSKLCTY